MKKTAGFFSWKCLGCGKSLISEATIDYAIKAGPSHRWMQDRPTWLTEGVVLVEGMERPLKGTYNGYGKLSGKDFNKYEHKGLGLSVFHERCWDSSGKPKEYLATSKHAEDQGYFLSDLDKWEKARPRRYTAPKKRVGPLKAPEPEDTDMSSWGDYKKIKHELMWKLNIKKVKPVWETILVGKEGRRTQQYHYMVVWQDLETQEYVGGSAYGTFGKSPKSVEISRDLDLKKAQGKVETKIYQKLKKYEPKADLIPNKFKPKSAPWFQGRYAYEGNLFNRVVRVAYENPDMRKELLNLLGTQPY